MMGENLHIVCPHCTTSNRVPSARAHGGARCGRCKGALFTGQPITLMGINFDAHLKHNDIPLLVDFWAPWCGPCRSMAPVFLEAAQRLEPKLRLAKVNTEEEQALAARFGIRSIPSLILFHQGREQSRQAGAMDLTRLLDWVKSVT